MIKNALYRVGQSLSEHLCRSRFLTTTSTDPYFHFSASAIANEFSYPREDVVTMLENDPSILHEYKHSLLSIGLEVVFSNPALSIIDEYLTDKDHNILSSSPYRHRVLRFNSSLNLVQSYAMYDTSSRTIDLSQSTNAEYTPHTIGLSIALQLLRVSRDPLRIAVLGAGAGILPMQLAHVLPRSAAIHAVEIDDNVLAAAKDYFNLTPYLSSSSTFTPIIMHRQCALLWMSEQPPSSLSLILVDIAQANASANTSLLAPSPAILDPQHLLHLLACLRPGGVLAINVLGDKTAESIVIGAVIRATNRCNVLLSVLPLNDATKKDQNSIVYVAKRTSDGVATRLTCDPTRLRGIVKDDADVNYVPYLNPYVQTTVSGFMKVYRYV